MNVQEIFKCSFGHIEGFSQIKHMTRFAWPFLPPRCDVRRRTEKIECGADRGGGVVTVGRPHPENHFRRGAGRNHPVARLDREGLLAIGTRGGDRQIASKHEGNAQRIHGARGIDRLCLSPAMESYDMPGRRRRERIRETDRWRLWVQVQEIEFVESLKDGLHVVGAGESEPIRDFLGSWGAAQERVLFQDIDPNDLSLWAQPGATDPPSPA